MRAMVAGLCMIVVVGPAAAQRAHRSSGATSTRPAATPDEVLVRLGRRVPDVSFDEAQLKDVFDWLGQQLGVNVWVRWKVLKEWEILPDEPISLRARDVRLSNVLWMILKEASPTVELSYGLVDNILVVSTRADLARETVTIVYNVNGLLLEKYPDFGSAGAFGSGHMTDINVMGRKLAETLRETVDPETWVENGGTGTVRYYNGRIIVRAGLDTQMQIRQVLLGLAITR